MNHVCSLANDFAGTDGFIACFLASNSTEFEFKKIFYHAPWLTPL